jgi:Zn-dependent membrane protease YugP
MPYFLGFDPIFMIIFAVSLVLSLVTSGLVRFQFSRGKTVQLRGGLSGREVAETILRDADIQDVSVVEHQGFLSDHYNPMTKTLALSHDVYHGRNAAAAGVAAHEVGHAIQHAHRYAPLWMRSVLVPVANIGSTLAPWLIMIGVFLSAGQAATKGTSFGEMLAIGGVVLFGAATLFALVTVPVEFNASSRARERLITLGITQPGEEANAVRGVLMAAGLTYVAAAITAVLHLLYWAWRAGLIGGRRND